MSHARQNNRLETVVECDPLVKMMHWRLSETLIASVSRLEVAYLTVRVSVLWAIGRSLQ
jgi:hypothetical protein